MEKLNIDDYKDKNLISNKYKTNKEKIFLFYKKFLKKSEKENTNEKDFLTCEGN